MLRRLLPILILAFVPVFAGAATVQTGALSTQIARGTIQSFAKCYPAGFAVTLDTGTTLIYLATSTIVYPKNATPTLGFAAFAITKGTTSCDTNPGTGVTTVTGRSVSYIGYTAPKPPETKPPAGSGSGSAGSSLGSSFMNQLQGLLGKITGSSGSGSTVTQVTQVTQGVAASANGLPFGGQIGMLQPCETPAGATLVTLGPPTPGEYLYIPGYSITYQCGPPSYTGQWLTGNADGPQMCDICFGTAYCPIPGKVINGRPGHGSSGCTVADAPKPPTTKPPTPSTQCGTNPDGFSLASDKRTAEQDLRADLSALGISVNRTNGCGLGESFQQYQQRNCPKEKQCGCTDVSGLQCTTLDYLKQLREICKTPFTISGGNELGHETHTGGNAVDVNGLDQCIKTKFEKIDNCNYIDRATGTRFYDENICGSKNKTGPHFHICVGGKCS